MGTQRVMDRTGDTVHEFDPANSVAVKEAMERFKDLTSKGFTAAERTEPGQSKVVRAFNPEAVETLFVPQLYGG